MMDSVLILMTKAKSKPQLNILLFFLLIDIHITTSQEGKQQPLFNFFETHLPLECKSFSILSDSF